MTEAGAGGAPGEDQLELPGSCRQPADAKAPRLPPTNPVRSHAVTI